MKKDGMLVALFDLDGVIVDSESHYFKFWDGIGKRFFPEMSDFAYKIKGQTLTQIYDQYFSESEQLRVQLTRELNDFEDSMSYDYIPGAYELLCELHDRGVRSGIVTSSNRKKMERVYAIHPELPELVDKIFTEEMFSRSKPAPDCYLMGAEFFSAQPSDCIVFEDSFNGLQSGMEAGMNVVGLSTTNPPEKLMGKCHYIIPDFIGFGYQNLLDIKSQLP